MKHYSLEAFLSYLILISALPCSVLALYLAWQANFSIYLIFLLGTVQAFVIALAIFHARHQLALRLRGIATVVEAACLGDFSIKAKREARGSAIQDLVDSVNTLSKDLSSDNRQIAEKGVLLQKIIDQIQVGVITLDLRGRLYSINAAAKRILELKPTNPLYSVSDLPIHFDHSRPVKTIINITQHNCIKRLFLQCETYRDGGEEHRLILLTEMDYLLRQEQFKSWEELVRVISHEINNSLSPISSLSQSMTSLLNENTIDHDNKQDLLRCSTMISERAKSLGAFIAKYRHLSTLNQQNYSNACVNSVLESVLSLFIRKKVYIESNDTYYCNIDTQQMQQVFINLIKNGFEAFDEASAMESEVRIVLSKEEDYDRSYLRVDIEDNGRGLANAKNLFVPFYSTKPSGSGIGLALSRQIVEMHRGTLTLANRYESRGCVATVRLPL
ncbi:MAG: hypothetical protein KTR17_12450 [Cellvibrionaceae bacterium]|nr:hypothetical protein [Cellvibrionaceae bacterium]